MSQSNFPPPGGPGSYPPPPPPQPVPPYGYQPPYPMPPASYPPVVHVHNHRAGFGRVVGGFIAAFGAMGFIFMLGIGSAFFGIMLLGFSMAGTGFEQQVFWSSYREGDSKIIAVLPVEGIIDAWQAEFVHACVEDILANNSVRAVVLRVDSPGGAVTPSDQIWYEVQRLRAAGRPVVASFGSVAASGGYYVSCGADSIMAEETTITGSIGVIAQIMTLHGLLDKVGIEPITLVASASPEKGVANDIFRSWNEEDRAQVLTLLDQTYEIFHTRVWNGRKNALGDVAAMEKIADGSIFTAKDAVTHRLVDAVGYLDDAIAHAETLAGIPTGRATVQRLHQPPTFFGGLGFQQSRDAQRRDPLDADTIRSLVNDLGSVQMMYLMH